MSMNTYLQGRLRNTPLPKSHGLLPLFEAVVNSIHAIEELGSAGVGDGEINIEVIRAPQIALTLDEPGVRRGAPPIEHIAGFKICDNGTGFHDDSFRSFETLDSDYKSKHGGRGVGRLLWLKAFDRVFITSNFRRGDVGSMRRSFSFSASKGVDELVLSEEHSNARHGTCVHLVDCND